MKTKIFHLGDVLSIITGSLLSPRHMKGVYDILNFMTGDSVYSHTISRFIDECGPYLVNQFPQLATPEMDLAIAELNELLKDKSEKAETDKIVADWLANQITKYGETFVVKPIPKDAHQCKDPRVELAEKIKGSETTIVVVEH